MKEENARLIEAVDTVQKAINRILEKETDPQEGAALNGSMELVKIAVSGYTLFNELADIELRSNVK